MNLTIKLGDRVVDMPMDFSFEQWLRVRKLGDNINDFNLLSACSGIDEKEIRRADLKQVEEISTILQYYYFSGKSADDIVLTFHHHGVEYGLQKDFSKLKYGAWVDLEVYASEDVEKNIPKILSLLYYPVKEWKKDKYILEEYSDELVNETAENFKDVPIRVWWGASTFFLLFVSKYTENMKNSLSTANTLTKWYLMMRKKLPKWLQRKLPADFIFNVIKF
jgi:hypothetical protein